MSLFTQIKTTSKASFLRVMMDQNGLIEGTDWNSALGFEWVVVQLDSAYGQARVEFRIRIFS